MGLSFLALTALQRHEIRRVCEMLAPPRSSPWGTGGLCLFRLAAGCNFPSPTASYLAENRNPEAIESSAARRCVLLLKDFRHADQEAVDIPSSEITPKSLYLNRRNFCRHRHHGAAALAGLGLREISSPSAVAAPMKN